MLDFNEEEFLFSGKPWLIGPWPRPTDQKDLLNRIVTVGVGKEEGMLRTVPAVFSDLPLAQQCIKEMEATRPGKEGMLKPFSTETASDFIEALQHLISRGHTHIAIDPGARQVRVPSIERLIDAIRNKFCKPPEREG